MRNKLVLTLIILTSLAWAVAQQQSTTRPAAPDTGATQPNTVPNEPGQSATPTPPAAGSMQMPESEMIEGCLGGSAPNFTVTDKAGTTYQLDIPEGANTAVLTKHVGESVQVMGALNDSGAASSDKAGTSAGATKGKTIAVQKIGRGNGSCPAGSGAGAAAPKPPSK